MKPKINDIYRHYKGGVYAIVSAPKESEKGKEVHLPQYEKEVVWYQNVVNGQIWVREEAEFWEEVEANGKVQPRFALVESRDLWGRVKL